MITCRVHTLLQGCRCELGPQDLVHIIQEVHRVKRRLNLHAICEKKAEKLKLKILRALCGLRPTFGVQSFLTPVITEAGRTK